jgi:hypothetical protein
VDDRPTIPGTADWPDMPLARAIIAVNAVKEMDGRAAQMLDTETETAASDYVQLVLTACGESGMEAEDVLQMSALTSDNMVRGGMARAMAEGAPIELRELGHSLWLDGFLHGVATARRLWADEETGVVELRPEEESDDAR